MLAELEAIDEAVDAMFVKPNEPLHTEREFIVLDGYGIIYRYSNACKYYNPYYCMTDYITRLVDDECCSVIPDCHSWSTDPYCGSFASEVWNGDLKEFVLTLHSPAEQARQFAAEVAMMDYCDEDECWWPETRRKKSVKEPGVPLHEVPFFAAPL